MGKINFKAMQLLDGDSGGSVIDEVTEYIQEYEELTQRLNEEEDHDIPLWVWLERQKKEGLTWSIEGLTELTGPLGPGTLAHVFARTHAGKTGFAISQIAHWALELRRRESKDVILFCSNEEPVPRIKQRIIKVNHTVDDKWIETHKEETEYLWNQYLKPWIILRHGVNDLFEIIRLIRRHKPIMVVIDQGPKVRIKGDYPQHQKLQILYQNYRQLAVRYNTRIMTLGQASADADDRKFIGIKMIDNAKTGLPGELDLAIGIGQLLSDSSRVNMRWLNVCKNKLTFNLGVKTCWVDPKNGKYK